MSSPTLADLEPGDEVYNDCGRNDGRIVTIEKVTLTQIVIADGDRYSITSGRFFGGRSRHSIRVIEPGDRERLRHQKLVDKLAGMRRSEWADLSLDVLEAVALATGMEAKK